nr:multidrug resistance-associated protein 4-like [Leptinotarsa decemlineata]XP_023012685.1 multidrug resistance-associated protein 4-like [Leptinotarsa decemlineata]XP_023012686.1 multidrug resistance-associated protein 4-like [Leptinotarsa decemlineata]
MDRKGPRKRKAHPKESANFLSKITFFYTKGIFWRTYKEGTIEEENLYDVLKNSQSELLGNELEKYFENDLKRHTSISLYRILWSCYGYEYLMLGLIQLIIRTLVIVSIPMTLSKVVLYFQPGQKEITKKDALILATLLVSLNFFSITYLHNYLLYLVEMGIRVRTAFCSVIYRKCLKMTSTALSKITVGKIVTLMTKDVTAIELAIFYGNDAWIGFVQAIIVCYLIYYRMGLAAFVGIGFFIVVMLIQIYVGNITKKLRMQSSKKTDERLQTTQETLSAIKFIKMNVWERFFEKKISYARKMEMKVILKTYLTKVTLLLLGTLTSKVAFYLLLMTYLWFGHTVTAELIYYISTLFLRIRHALNVAIPTGVTTIAELRTAIDRIEDLMSATVLSTVENQELLQTKPRIMLKNVTVSIDNTKLLENVSFTVTTGLTFLGGPTASGKSILLKTILREYDLETGSNDTSGSISYSSQEPWIFPSSLRQNIIFGQQFIQSRYDEVLNICDLQLDIQSFAEGDNVIIGDKGTNVSKGQKSRISLARAVYKEADIYLLDDCLTSLDVQVRKTVFKKCIREFLGNKIVIFVTQHLESVLPGDNLIIMQNGEVSLQKITHRENDNNAKSDILNNSELAVVVEMNNNNISETDDEFSSEATKLLDYNQKSATKNVYQEAKHSGKVPWDVYAEYINYGGGYCVMILILILFVGTQFAKSYTEKILSNWIDDVHETQLVAENSNETIINEPPPSITVLYSSLTTATVILCLVTSFSFFNFTKKSSVGLHKSMVNGIVHAAMQFFDSNFIGNILNRFSNDLRIIDELFPVIVFEFFEILFGICGTVFLIATVNTIIMIPTLIICACLFLLRKLYIPTGRNLQRLETATKGPVVGYLNATLEGLPTIRAFKTEYLLTKEFDNHQDLYTSANFTSKSCQRAFGFALDVCCTLFIAFIIGICLIFDKDTSVGNVGLAITQAFTLSSVVQYGIRQWAEIESKITSVERVLEYTEAPLEYQKKISKTSWPLDATIVYENVSFGYEKNGLNVLRNMSFTIKNKEKIGIVGRTGAGKTSIMSTLFRLYEYEGKITIGGMDIKDLSLDILRSNIAIIPQDPVLFSGTIRSNIDPFDKYEDEVIWKAVDKVGLKPLFSSLSARISGGGSNFSSGQKQLICLARALVSGNRILVLDEATADMDQETDQLINKAVFDSFSGCTLIIIAHRLHSIMFCDRVMVIETGQVQEFDKPDILAQVQGGIFHGMLKEAGLLK